MIDPKVNNKSYETFVASESQIDLISDSADNDQKERDGCCFKDWDKYIYTVLIMLGHFLNFFSNSLFSSTMVDMTYLFQTSIENISYVNAFFGLGYVCGSLIGLTFKYFNRHILFIVVTLVQTIFFILMPMVPSYWGLYVTAFLIKVGASAFECGSYVWLIYLWRDNYSSVTHIVKAAASLGMMAGPLLGSSYVLGDVTRNDSDLKLLNRTVRDQINYSFERRSNLVTPFLIGSVISSMLPIGLCIMFFIKSYDPNNNPVLNTSHQNNKVTETKNIRTSVKYLTIALISISLCGVHGSALGHLTYAPTYYQYLGFTASKASEISSVMPMFHGLGRVIAVFESMLCSTEVMLIIHLMIAFLCQGILLISQTNMIIVYVGNAVLGLGYSSLFASYLNLTEKHLKLTESITSLFLFSAELLLTFFPFIIGPLIEKMPEILLFSELGYSLINIIIFFVISILIKYDFWSKTISEE